MQSEGADVSDREKNFAGMFMSALLLFLSLSSESTIRISLRKPARNEMRISFLLEIKPQGLYRQTFTKAFHCKLGRRIDVVE